MVQIINVIEVTHSGNAVTHSGNSYSTIEDPFATGKVCLFLYD